MREEYANSLLTMLIEVFDEYPSAKNLPFPDETIRMLLEAKLPKLLLEITNDFNHGKWKCDGSIGKGAWAKVPWVAILNPLITDTVSKGVYVVYLFCSDGSGVYLTLNQGTGGIKKAVTNGLHESRRNKILGTLTDFNHSYNIGPLNYNSLRGGGLQRPRAYEEACILWKYYGKDDLKVIKDKNLLINDLEEIVGIYSKIKSDSKIANIKDQSNYWQIAPGEQARLWNDWEHYQFVKKN